MKRPTKSFRTYLFEKMFNRWIISSPARDGSYILVYLKGFRLSEWSGDHYCEGYETTYQKGLPGKIVYKNNFDWMRMLDYHEFKDKLVARSLTTKLAKFMLAGEK